MNSLTIKDKTPGTSFAAFSDNETCFQPWGQPDKGSLVRKALGIPLAVRTWLWGEMSEWKPVAAGADWRGSGVPVLWAPGRSRVPTPPCRPLTQSPASHSVLFPVLFFL